MNGKRISFSSEKYLSEFPMLWGYYSDVSSFMGLSFNLIEYTRM